MELYIFRRIEKGSMAAILQRFTKKMGIQFSKPITAFEHFSGDGKTSDNKLFSMSYFKDRNYFGENLSYKGIVHYNKCLMTFYPPDDADSLQYFPLIAPEDVDAVIFTYGYSDGIEKGFFRTMQDYINLYLFMTLQVVNARIEQGIDYEVLDNEKLSKLAFEILSKECSLDCYTFTNLGNGSFILSRYKFPAAPEKEGKKFYDFYKKYSSIHDYIIMRALENGYVKKINLKNE